MEYFNLLEFKKEPFSNSPEPEFLFASHQHNSCLQMLELAVRLRRGLSIIIGEVGTGKTTLCRKLIQNLSLAASNDTAPVDTYLLLDPAVENRLEFVKTVAVILGIELLEEESNEWQIKERIKKYLFEKGIEEQKIIALIIDEGQKIPDDCLEVLREFLNYETNDFKLLQIIIFAQPEIRKSLAVKRNLLDRVNYIYDLKPLSFMQMKAMIEYRISVASQKPDDHSLLTFSGLLAVYLSTAGYPRKIVSLCHQIVLKMIIKGKSKAGWFLVRSCISNLPKPVIKRVPWPGLGTVTAIILFILAIAYFSDHSLWQSKEKSLLAISGFDVKKELFSKKPVKINENANESKQPQLLGSMTLKKRMTIWRVFENIYGDSSEEIKKEFISANPQIGNLNDTVEGTIIHVPAISSGININTEKPITVSLQTGKDLATIYHSYIGINSRQGIPPLLFLSIWDKKNGPQFSIILDKKFKSIEDAQNAIRQLPGDLSKTARILKEWEEGALLYNRRFLKS